MHVCNALNLEGRIFSSLILTKFSCYSLFSSHFAHSHFQSSIVTSVRVACKQKPKLTLVLHHAEAYFFCLMIVFNHASVSPHFRILIRNWFSISGRACCGFSARDATQPSLAPPMAWHPWRPHTPHAPPLSLSFGFPRSNSLSLSSTSLPPLCPR
jgi:hypothetical protein